MDMYRQMKEHFPNIKLKTLKLQFKQIVTAIQYLHNEKRICHFDIKPENIGIDKNGQAKLMDFGYSCKVDELNEHVIRKLFKNRSKLYLSPEILAVTNMFGRQ